MHLSEILGALSSSLPPVAFEHLPNIQRASFGVSDSLFLVVIALIVFGPKKLPEISRTVGKLLYEFRKASNDFKLQIEEELRASEQAEREQQLAAQAAAPQPATPVALSAEETVSTDGTPTIMPPSTGEPVSTLPPHQTVLSRIEQGEDSGEDVSSEISSECGPETTAASDPVQQIHVEVEEVRSDDTTPPRASKDTSKDMNIEEVQGAARAAEDLSLQHAVTGQLRENAAIHHG
jgi:Tat protein translocase TatB subunit